MIWESFVVILKMSKNLNCHAGKPKGYRGRI